MLNIDQSIVYKDIFIKNLVLVYKIYLYYKYSKKIGEYKVLGMKRNV